jgi:hypothetical protein
MPIFYDVPEILYFFAIVLVITHISSILKKVMREWLDSRPGERCDGLPNGAQSP